MVNGDGLCGRPTKPGTPCRSVIPYGQVACTIHQTEAENADQAGYKRGFQAGLKTGEERGYYRGLQDGRLAAARDQQQAQDEASVFDPNNPLVDVLVDGPRQQRLTYRWGLPVPPTLGDRVLVPAPYWAPDRSVIPDWEGEVVNLSSDYQGSGLVSVRCRLAG